VSVAIHSLDIAIIVVVVGTLSLLHRRWMLWLGIVTEVLLGAVIYGHYRLHVSWILLGKIGANAAIPMVMALVGNYLAAEIEESVVEKRLWRALFITLAIAGIVGSFFVETELDKEHATEVAGLHKDLDGIGRFLREHPPAGFSKQQMSDVLRGFVQPPSQPPPQEHQRAYLHVDDVAIEIQQIGLEKKYPMNVIAHISGHNVSVFTATLPSPVIQASISFRPPIPPEHVAEEQDLFTHGAWANEAYLGYKHVLNPLEPFSFSKRRSLILDDPNPFSFDTWNKIAHGDYVIYVVTRAIYSDKWGKLPEEHSCSTFSAKDNFRRGICWGDYQQ
jgi:hypothetical protein